MMSRFTPEGERWYSDPGAIPGEPYLFLDVPDEAPADAPILGAKAAIVQAEGERWPVRVIAPTGSILQVFNEFDEAKSWAEKEYPANGNGHEPGREAAPQDPYLAQQEVEEEETEPLNGHATTPGNPDGPKVGDIIRTTQQVEWVDDGEVEHYAPVGTTGHIVSVGPIQNPEVVDYEVDLDEPLASGMDMLYLEVDEFKVVGSNGHKPKKRKQSARQRAYRACITKKLKGKKLGDRVTARAAMKEAAASCKQPAADGGKSEEKKEKEKEYVPKKKKAQIEARVDGAGKHTPGPWYSNLHRGLGEYIIGPGKGQHVATVTTGAGRPNAEADARLIVAAPDLLNAAILAEDTLKLAAEAAQEAGQPGAATFRKHAGTVLAAVAKATGGTNGHSNGRPVWVASKAGALGMPGDVSDYLMPHEDSDIDEALGFVTWEEGSDQTSTYYGHLPDGKKFGPFSGDDAVLQARYAVEEALKAKTGSNGNGHSNGRNGNGTYEGGSNGNGSNGRPDVGAALEETLEKMANAHAAEAWSTPGDEMTAELGGDVWVKADFGGELAVNGDLVGPGEIPTAPEGFEEMPSHGGRVPTTEEEISVESAVRAVARRLKVPEERVQKVVDGMGLGELVYRSVSGETEVWARPKGSNGHSNGKASEAVVEKSGPYWKVGVYQAGEYVDGATTANLIEIGTWLGERYPGSKITVKGTIGVEGSNGNGHLTGKESPCAVAFNVGLFVDNMREVAGAWNEGAIGRPSAKTAIKNARRLFELIDDWAVAHDLDLNNVESTLDRVELAVKTDLRPLPIEHYPKKTVTLLLQVLKDCVVEKK